MVNDADAMATYPLPDLDAELTGALGHVEEQLLSLLGEDEPGSEEAFVLAEPLAGRVTLDALGRVQAAITPTQTRADAHGQLHPPVQGCCPAAGSRRPLPAPPAAPGDTPLTPQTFTCRRPPPRTGPPARIPSSPNQSPAAPRRTAHLWPASEPVALLESGRIPEQLKQAFD